jgi:hypothetical protein
MSEPEGQGRGERGRERVTVTLPAELCAKLSEFCPEWKVSPDRVMEGALEDYFREGDMSR